MKKTNGKMQKFIKNYVKNLYFTDKAPLKKNLIKTSFDVTIDGKTAKTAVVIKNKQFVNYDDKNIKKTFKHLSPLAEAILDATIANYISHDYLADV